MFRFCNDEYVEADLLKTKEASMAFSRLNNSRAIVNKVLSKTGYTIFKSMMADKTTSNDFNILKLRLKRVFPVNAIIESNIDINLDMYVVDESYDKIKDDERDVKIDFLIEVLNRTKISSKLEKLFLRLKRLFPTDKEFINSIKVETNINARTELCYFKIILKFKKNYFNIVEEGEKKIYNEFIKDEYLGEVVGWSNPYKALAIDSDKFKIEYEESIGKSE